MTLSMQSPSRLNKLKLIVPLLLAVSLSSCGSRETTACPTLPPALIGHMDNTSFNGNSYGDVAQYAVILKRERDMCLNRIDRIREWQVEDAQH